MSTPTLVPIGTVGSQQVQQPPQTIYLRQTDPNFTQPLSSRFGGLDNGYYASGDLLFHTGTAFARTPVAGSGCVMLADPTQKTGARWSNQFLLASLSIYNYISALPSISSTLATAQNDLADVQAGVAQSVGNKQTLVTNFTNLDLYVANQAEQVSAVGATVAAASLTVQTERAAIANIFTNVTALQSNIAAAAAVRDGVASEIAGYNNTLAGVQTNLGSLSGSDLGAINQLINGDFTVWQRATSYSGPPTAAFPTADRWFHATGVGGTLSSARVLATLPASGRYSAPQTVNALQVTLTNNSGTFYLSTAVEEHVQQTVTFSVWLKSAAPVTLSCSVIQRPSSGADTAYAATNFSVTSTWTQFSAAFPLTTQTNGQLTLVRLAGASWPTVTVARAQLQYGAAPLEFEERHAQTDVALCQRYYETGYDLFQDYADAYSYISAFHTYAAVKRVAPALTLASTGNSGFLDPVSVGAVSNTYMGSSMRQKNNRSEVGSFATTWAADAEIYGQ